MAVKVDIINVKQPITDQSGYITKAHFDFLRRLWLRTGGDQDAIDGLIDDSAFAELFIFRNRIRDLEKRVEDLEKQLISIGC